MNVADKWDHNLLGSVFGRFMGLDTFAWQQNCLDFSPKILLIRPANLQYRVL